MWDSLIKSEKHGIEHGYGLEMWASRSNYVEAMCCLNQHLTSVTYACVHHRQSFLHSLGNTGQPKKFWAAATKESACNLRSKCNSPALHYLHYVFVDLCKWKLQSSRLSTKLYKLCKQRVVNYFGPKYGRITLCCVIVKPGLWTIE